MGMPESDLWRGLTGAERQIAPYAPSVGTFCITVPLLSPVRDNKQSEPKEGFTGAAAAAAGKPFAKRIHLFSQANEEKKYF